MLEKNIKQSLANLNSSKSSSATPTQQLLLFSQTDRYLEVYEKNPRANHQLFQQFAAIFQNWSQQTFTNKNNVYMKDYDFQILNSIGKKYNIGEFSIDSKSKTISMKKLSGEKYRVNSQVRVQKQGGESEKSTSKSEEPLLFPEEFEKQIRKAYQEHKIDKAYELMSQFRKKSSVKLSPELESFLKNVEEQYTSMIKSYQQFSEGEWKLDREEDGISLHYKIYQEEKQIAILIESEFQIPIDEFMAIVTEIDLMERYVPFAKQTKQKKNISRNQKIGWSCMSVPILSDRQVYFYAAGYDRISTKGSVFFHSKTVNGNESIQAKYDFHVPETTQLVRIEYKFFILEYIPISVTKGKVRLASNVDLKLRFVPLFILSKTARIFAFNYFRNIKEASRQFKGSAWEKKMVEKPHVYKFFRKKVQDYFD